MASKFQNRLVGAVVLVAVGVIFLPTLLDGDKKYNEDQFAAIPLVPKPGDEQDIESIAPIEQTTTPSTPSEGASEAMISEAVTGIEAQQPSTTNTPNIEQQP
ncbi:cell division protein DedD, partial [Pseudomonas aeruginosa]